LESLIGWPLFPGKSATMAAFSIAGGYPLDAEEVFAQSLMRDTLNDMPLESCPICGYALSTVTRQCRHCTSEPALGNIHKGRLLLALLSAAIIASLLYFRTVHLR
jgi:hypothetical protein